MSAKLVPALLVFYCAAAFGAETPGPRTLTLDEAVKTAIVHQPQILQARANTAAAYARADEARAPILPQLVGVAGYTRKTVNVASGTFSSAATPPPNFTTYNYFNAGLSLSQFIWDFGQTTDRWAASKDTAQSQRDTEHATRLSVILNVRTAWFVARATRDLLQVAKETLANYELHLKQITEMVRVGTHPEIDLAQARSDRATAEAQLIAAENNWSVARAQLNTTMGVERSIDFDIDLSPPAPVDGEDLSPDVLADEAMRARPELAAYMQQVHAQELIIRSYKGGYGPSIGATMNFTDAGTDITNLAWNWNAGVNLTWPLFSGLLTKSQVEEQKANLVALDAQRESFRQGILLELEQASLGVRAAKSLIRATDDALFNARERLRLAERRFAQGIGNAIELGDAQVAVATAAAQRAQAEFNLGTARSQLLHALGRTT